MSRLTLHPRYAAASVPLALTSALIWMLHPLQTEAVNYVTQRTELLMGLFYLLTLYCAIRATHSHVRNRWHLAAIVCCLLGMGCKESMMTAPIIVVLYDRVFVFNSAREAWSVRKPLYLGLAASWIELALLTTSRSNTVGFATGTPVWTYLLNQASMIAQYLKLTVWPQRLVFDYGLPRAFTLADVFPQGLLVVGLLVATAIALSVRPMFGFLGAWFFIALAPTSSFVPIASEVGAERRMYLPLAALVVLTTVGGYLLFERLKKVVAHSRRPLPARLAPAVAAVAVMALLVALACGTVQRNHDYSSSVSLLRTAVERWPHGRAHLNLAVALKMQGNRDEAMEHMRKAVVDDLNARYVLGSELFDRGRFNEAISELREFVRRKPTHLIDVLAARNLIGLSLAQQGRLSEAAEELQEALTIGPNNADLHGNLAYVLLEQKDFEGAIVQYQEFLRSRPGNAFVLTNLGIAHAALGHIEEAGQHFREALAVDPNYVEARTRLATLDQQRR